MTARLLGGGAVSSRLPRPQRCAGKARRQPPRAAAAYATGAGGSAAAAPGGSCLCDGGERQRGSCPGRRLPGWADLQMAASWAAACCRSCTLSTRPSARSHTLPPPPQNTHTNTRAHTFSLARHTHTLPRSSAVWQLWRQRLAARALGVRTPSHLHPHSHDAHTHPPTHLHRSSASPVALAVARRRTCTTSTPQTATSSAPRARSTRSRASRAAQTAASAYGTTATGRTTPLM